MRIREFDWDEHNVEHLALHDITPEEAEEVLTLDPMFYRGKRRRRARNPDIRNYEAWGQTVDGRYLIIIFDLHPGGTARPVTGWDMDAKQRRRYRTKKR